MFQNAFAKLGREECETVLKEINPVIEGSPFAAETVTILGQELSFYPGYYFYDIADYDSVPGKKRFAVYRPGDVTVLDGTNAPIYALNRRVPMTLDEQNVQDYARFFFGHVRGKNGAFNIVESVDDIPWLDEPPAAARKAIGSSIKPVRLTGRGRNETYQLEACAVYRDRLLQIRIDIASDGTVDIRNEKLLSDGLPVTSDELFS